MTQDKTTTRRVYDLGLAAFIKWKGFQVTEVQKRHIGFACTNDAEYRKIVDLELVYINSEYARFDGMVMDLKSLPVVEVNEVDTKIHLVDSLGQSAFLHMSRSSNLQWFIIGRTRYNKYAFEVTPKDMDIFKATRIAWSNSPYREFNQEIMSIKTLRKRSI